MLGIERPLLAILKLFQYEITNFSIQESIHGQYKSIEQR
jgi:hypothetical protein